MSCIRPKEYNTKQHSSHFFEAESFDVVLPFLFLFHPSSFPLAPTMVDLLLSSSGAMCSILMELKWSIYLSSAGGGRGGKGGNTRRRGGKKEKGGEMVVNLLLPPPPRCHNPPPRPLFVLLFYIFKLAYTGNHNSN